MAQYSIQSVKSGTTLESLDTTHGWDRAETGSIDYFQWTPEIVKPQVEFQMLYQSDLFFLRFLVEEAALHTTHVGHQTEVWKDNCVEWFVRPGKGTEVPYFNFEFNCLGYLLLAHGTGRSNRKPVPIAEIEQVECRTTLNEPVVDETPGIKSWKLEAAIPASIILDHAMGTPPGPGVVWQGNFNKCSESTRIPHWGTWNRVETEKPDFHRPEFFGDLIFK